MPFTVTMPKLSPTMEEGTIVKWHKKVGEWVQAGDVLLEVATDKATVEYQALDEGWLRQILVPEGKDAMVNQPIALFTLEEHESIEGVPSSPAAPSASKQADPSFSDTQAVSTANQIENHPLTEPPLKKRALECSTEPFERRIFASPLAKKIARERGLDLSSVKGTGPNQRIMSRDLVNAGPLAVVSSSSSAKSRLPPGTYEEQPLSPMRKVIAQRLQESKSSIPHFYITQIIDAEPLVSIREQLKVHNVKLSINDFIVRASALALRQHPALNSGFNPVHQATMQFKTVDIAIAVSLEAGLITPIVRHADDKSLTEVSLEIRMLAQKAREGKLTPSEYQGGSFTISNLGMYGVSEFQAILNPPQSAILAVSGIREVPVVRAGIVVPGKSLTLTLSVDHRVIDGVAAALFLQTLQNFLENPAFLLIN